MKFSEGTDTISHLWASWRMTSAIANYLENLSAYSFYSAYSQLPVIIATWRGVWNNNWGMFSVSLDVLSFFASLFVEICSVSSIVIPFCFLFPSDFLNSHVNIRLAVKRQKGQWMLF